MQFNSQPGYFERVYCVDVILVSLALGVSGDRYAVDPSPDKSRRSRCVSNPGTETIMIPHAQRWRNTLSMTSTDVSRTRSVCPAFFQTSLSGCGERMKPLGPTTIPYGTVTLSLSSRPERRDLRFRGPLLEMFFGPAGEICSRPRNHQSSRKPRRRKFSAPCDEWWLFRLSVQCPFNAFNAISPVPSTPSLQRRPKGRAGFSALD
jgi:hypothetical protein